MDTPASCNTSTFSCYTPGTIETPLPFSPSGNTFGPQDAYFDPLPFENSHPCFMASQFYIGRFNLLVDPLIPMIDSSGLTPGPAQPSELYFEPIPSQNTVDLQELSLRDPIEPIRVTIPTAPVSITSSFNTCPITVPSQQDNLRSPLLYNTAHCLSSLSAAQIQLPPTEPEPKLQLSPFDPDASSSCPQTLNTPEISGQTLDGLEKRFIYCTISNTSRSYNPNSRKAKARYSYRRTYDCAKCSYWTNRECNLTRHYLKHHTDYKRPRCLKCEKYFDNDFNIKRHVRFSRTCK
ncbi:C2H2-type zinc finger transcription factor [Phycomyces blakesleeanus]